MPSKKQKLELTWIGKENRPKLEPRILLEDPEKSYHAPHRVGENDLFDNKLIFGDNLLALKALEQEYAGKVKCVYIDPPFNTGQAFEHYDDGVEHSLWLSLMRDRLNLLRTLLANQGSIFIHIDDVELGYLIVLCDEVFGRKNRVSIITFKQGSATGHKSINPGCVSNSNFLLWYSKDKSLWEPNRVFTKRGRNDRYNRFIKNVDSDFSKWEIVPLSEAFAAFLGVDKRKIKQTSGFEEKLDKFVFENHRSVVQLARPNYAGVSGDARDMIDKSKADPETVFFLPRDGYSDMYFIRGERILFFTNTLKKIDGNLVPGEPLTTLWDDIPSHNLHKEGSVSFPKGKKPEGLIKRVFELTTNKGDIVLDSFLGSGTTAVVAHKMGLRWIGIELGDHCHSHCIPRLQSVIDNADPSGITKAVDWKGGGGFRYYKLAPSLLEKDKWDNWVISKDYNPTMLAQAVCKLEGFTYEPSDTHYWMHGHSTEQDFLYVTTANLKHAQLQQLSDEVGPDRSLLVVCTSFRGSKEGYPNLTVKKIPKAVLNRCEWGKDDYSLRVENLPDAPPPPPKAGQQELFDGEEAQS